jgi:4-diphosphocytidyl-2-C-methyl-D-erythritol kinase
MGEPVELVAPAKVTLSLRVTGVRSDGYHLIDAEMVSIDLGDRLVVSEGDGLEVRSHTGGPLPVDEDNLVRRALVLVGRRAHVRLDKQIPAGAGLGGGSADAAAILRWAGETDLVRAASIGADVPFCVIGGRARVTGIGEEVEPLPFVGGELTLLTPPFGCSTIEVYAAWDELRGPQGGDGGNDLETAALTVEPRLAGYRDRLREATGREPRLAGSGSTWFVEGAFPGEDRKVVRRIRAARA